jgi:hypothetical protein
MLVWAECPSCFGKVRVDIGLVNPDATCALCGKEFRVRLVGPASLVDPQQAQAKKPARRADEVRWLKDP